MILWDQMTGFFLYILINFTCVLIIILMCLLLSFIYIISHFLLFVSLFKIVIIIRSFLSWPLLAQTTNHNCRLDSDTFDVDAPARRAERCDATPRIVDSASWHCRTLAASTTLRSPQSSWLLATWSPPIWAHNYASRLSCTRKIAYLLFFFFSLIDRVFLYLTSWFRSSF